MILKRKKLRAFCMMLRDGRQAAGPNEEKRDIEYKY